jgi:hypothetical protein
MATASLPDRAEGLRLFISYARVDREPVERLAKALAAAGHRVWWDAALEGGHHFAAEIERELNAADAVVVVWSASSVTSNWVLDEAMHGRDRGCLIPVRFDETMPPLGYRQLQTIDLVDGADDDEVAAISRAAARITGTKPLPPRPKTAVEKAMDAARVMMADDSLLGTGRGRKKEQPVWVPFAWAAFGLVAWLIVSVMR